MEEDFAFPLPPGFDEHAAQMHQRYRMPDWMQAPPNWLPGVVPVEQVIARTPDAVVQVAAVRAFPVGFSFELRSMLREPRPEIDQMMFGMPGMPGPGGDLPDGLLRVAFRYADGTTASTLGMFSPPPMPPSADGTPAGPTMMPGGGGGGGGEYSTSYWCWPLPPEGTITVICEWPAAGIQREVTELDAGPIREAATRAERLWDDPPDPPTNRFGAPNVVVR